MGCVRSGERPSMVTTDLPAACETGVTHARIGDPLMCTVQAPQSAMPQPNLVPVRPSVSRKTQRSGMAAGTSTDCGLPLTVNLTAGIQTLPWLEYFKGKIVRSERHTSELPS